MRCRSYRKHWQALDGALAPARFERENGGGILTNGLSAPTRPVVLRRTGWLSRTLRLLTAAFRPPPKPPVLPNLTWLERADQLRAERRKELEEMERGPLPAWFKAKKP